VAAEVVDQVYCCNDVRANGLPTDTKEETSKAVWPRGLVCGSWWIACQISSSVNGLSSDDKSGVGN
jgi:hypothetical protein